MNNQHTPKICPKCGASSVRRVPRTGPEKLLEPLVKLKAYRCEACTKRFTLKAS